MDSSQDFYARGGSPVDLSKDFEFRFEFDIEEDFEDIDEDIEAELGEFVRLVRLDLVADAREQFGKMLAPHIHMFPVFAEYAELLVSEYSYEELLEKLPTSRAQCGFSETEWSLVTLLNTLAKLHLEGSRSDARLSATLLRDARDWRDSQDFVHLQELDDVQIQCTEIYLRIMVSPPVCPPVRVLTDADCQPPFSKPNGPRWHGYREMIPALLDVGKVWEAHNIFKLLLYVSESDEAETLFRDFLSRLQQHKMEDEEKIVARLDATKAYLRYGLSIYSRLSLANLAKLTEFAKRDIIRLFPDSSEDSAASKNHGKRKHMERSTSFSIEPAASTHFQSFIYPSRLDEMFSHRWQPMSARGTPAKYEITGSSGHPWHNRETRHAMMRP